MRLTLAGEVVAAASGEPYEDYVRRRIRGPLGLDSTTPDMPERERGGRLGIGYSAITREGTRLPGSFFAARGIAPAAGYASTAEDLARFASWQFRVLDRKGGEEVLGASTLREMHRRPLGRSRLRDDVGAELLPSSPGRTVSRASGSRQWTRCACRS